MNKDEKIEVKRGLFIYWFVCVILSIILFITSGISNHSFCHGIIVFICSLGVFFVFGFVVYLGIIIANKVIK